MDMFGQCVSVVFIQTVALLLQFIWIKNWLRHKVSMAGRAPGGFDSYDTHGYSSYHAGAPPTGASSCKLYLK